MSKDDNRNLTQLEQVELAEKEFLEELKKSKKALQKKKKKESNLSVYKDLLSGDYKYTNKVKAKKKPNQEDFDKIPVTLSRRNIQDRLYSEKILEFISIFACTHLEIEIPDSQKLKVKQYINKFSTTAIHIINMNTKCISVGYLLHNGRDKFEKEFIDSLFESYNFLFFVAQTHNKEAAIRELQKFERKGKEIGLVIISNNVNGDILIEKRPSFQNTDFHKVNIYEKLFFQKPYITK